MKKERKKDKERNSNKKTEVQKGIIICQEMRKNLKQCHLPSEVKT